MSGVPAHPRLSHMVLRAQQLGVSALGCLLAALLSERDLFRTLGSGSNSSSSSEGRSADLAARLRVLLGTGEADSLDYARGHLLCYVMLCYVMLLSPIHLSWCCSTGTS